MKTPLRLASLLLLTTASPAFAAEEGGLLAINSGLMVWTVVIFLVVLGVLYKLAYPSILGAVEARERAIEEMIAAAARDRAAAEAVLAEHRSQLEQSRVQAQEVLAESRTAAERAREQMLTETRREQEEMLLRARREIDQERDRAVEAVRREAVEIAMAAAEKLIGRNLSGDDNRRLVLEYLGELDGSAPVPAGV
ncbi:MAG: F0F1 ATP synthase subunit B [Gemmatimonadota bacterium]|jgi:F-type H+-transporting ATPase subunit b|nr:F0F1 ATP synthase subunit B [Gemmatimonadota bacterium]